MSGDVYELLDTGEEQKLEALGPYRVARQATAAQWPKRLSPGEWKQLDALHHRSKTGGGYWEKHKIPEAWTLRHGGLKFQLRLTDFGHIGLFPEQAPNWDWLREQIAGNDWKVMNLFGYTGGSSLACASAGAQVTHVDASKGVVGWGRENQELNQLPDGRIRWLVDDVMLFVQREIRRGNRYQGLILDPPSFGRGPKGQVWKIEDHLISLLEDMAKLAPEPKFILLSCHTPGYSGLVLRNILHLVFQVPLHQITCGEMTTPVGDTGLLLPSGTWARFGR